MGSRPAPAGIAIVGPTATGKSALALEVARRLPVEIISVDSRQVYRGLDVGTAKPRAEDRRRVPHHGLDLVDPDQRYSAGRFARDARRWIADIRARGRVPLLVGGTGFFLRALTDPLFREPTLAPGRRRSLRAYLEALPRARRLRWLRALDPEAAARLEPGGGAQREARALEVALLSGRPLTQWHALGPAAKAVDLLVFALDVDPARLAARIEARLDAMIANGLLEEVRSLAERYGTRAPAFRTSGYGEFVPWLEGTRSVEEATRVARTNTRRLARRQRTWFRHQLPASARRLDGERSASSLAESIASAWGDVAGPPGEATG
ncbi:MAG TPA: tRNA (adenosine(37)-N6)-dimethylallyltransferase MiaA [Longimicrobiales bacterium]|nr:tRNA (adenosine(37)-N6)-dimethylallyltransferase MiaA [Longimicrobiales bacterium]